jgi:HK97 family phage major capsid protein
LSGASSAGWVGSVLPKPVGQQSWDLVRLPNYKASCIVVLTKELLKLAAPSSEAAIRDSLIAGVASYLDGQLLDPTVAAVLNVNPASITNGATQVSSTGSTAAQILADLTAMVNAITTNLVSPVWVLRTRTALALTGKLTTGGAIAFPGISAAGGTLLGIQVLTTSNMPAGAGSPTTNYIALIDAASLLVADEERVRVDLAQEATLQMNSAPAAGAQQQTSLWQNSLVGIRVEREVAWLRGHDGCASFMEVSY